MPDPTLDRAQFLSRTDILQGASPDARAAFGQICKPRSYADGETLFREGALADFLVLIEAGRVRCTRAGSEITVLESGETLGVSSFLDRGPRNVDAVAIGEVLTLIVERRDFESVAARHPALLQGLTSVMNRHLRSVLDVAVSRRTFMGG